MTQRSATDDQLAPIIRNALAEIIDELPPAPTDMPVAAAAAARGHRSPTPAAGRIVALAAACVVLVGGLALLASRRGEEPTTTAQPATHTEESPPAGATATPWENGVRMVVYVGAEASDASLQLVRDQLDGLSTIVDADGIRYLDPQASLDEARRLLVDDPTTLDLLTVDNIPTAFYITPLDGVTYDDLVAAAASIEVLPEVIRVDIDPDG